MSEIETFPLRWPTGWPRTAYSESSRFQTRLDDAKHRLERELELLGATSIVLTTNRPRRKDGYLAMNQPKQLDPAACVWFVLDGEERAIPCDKWDRLADNIHAIELTVAALRGLSRWGANEMVRAAFAGFAALPAGNTAGDAWYDVLGVDPDASPAEIETAYRMEARTAHPDAGGSTEAFLQLQEAYRQAKAVRP